MSNLFEVLVTCDSNNTLWTCSIWDFHTGTNLMTYKGGGTAESRTLSFIGSDYLAAIEKAKPVLHIWPLNSQQTVQGMRFILPGRASAFAVTPDGSYFVAGIDEKIYLWQVSSGSLLTIINRHYQKVNILKFASGGRFFVSAAEDGMVMLWSLATVGGNSEVELITQSIAGQHDPVYVFSDHSLPVTDLCISKTGMHGRLFTVSSDRSCKIYDLTCGEMLLNLIFDEPLSSITLDVLELNIYIGSTEGKIFQYSLTHPPRNRDELIGIEENRNVFLSHTKAVTCLSVSLNGDILMSGSNDEQIILWHIKSKQPVRVIRHKGPITNAFFTTNYDAIYNQDFTPSIVLRNLVRTLEENNKGAELEVLVRKENNFWPKYDDDSINTSYDGVVSKEMELELKQNETKLNLELEKMKQINSNLYAISIENVLKSIPTDNIRQNHNTPNTKNKKKKKKNKKTIF